MDMDMDKEGGLIIWRWIWTWTAGSWRCRQTENHSAPRKAWACGMARARAMWPQKEISAARLQSTQAEVVCGMVLRWYVVWCWGGVWHGAGVVRGMVLRRCVA